MQGVIESGELVRLILPQPMTAILQPGRPYRKQVETLCHKLFNAPQFIQLDAETSAHYMGDDTLPNDPRLMIKYNFYFKRED